MDRHFFGTKNDLLPGIKTLESVIDLKYVLCGLFNSSEGQVYHSILDFENLCVHVNGDHVFNDRFLVVERNEHVIIRQVTQVSGGIKYAIDQLKNSNSVFFEAGGLFEDMYLVHGRIASVSNTSKAKELYKALTKYITKGFKKVGNFYIGDEAYHFGKNGGRLITIGIKSPVEYDLKV